MSFSPPNYTQFPNEIIDKWLPELGLGEIKVLLLILRKTIGWHKQEDRISLSQFMELTGLTKANVIIAIRNLVEKQMILRRKQGKDGEQVSYYQLNMDRSKENNTGYRSDHEAGIAAIPTKETLQKKSRKDIGPDTSDLPNQPPKIEEKNDIASAGGERLNSFDKKEESPEEQLKKVLTEEFQNLPELIQIEALKVFKEARELSNLKISAFKKKGGKIHNAKPFVLKILRQTAESILSRERKNQDRKKKKFKPSILEE